MAEDPWAQFRDADAATTDVWAQFKDAPAQKPAPEPPSTAPTVFAGDDAITPVDRKVPPPSA